MSWPGQEYYLQHVIKPTTAVSQRQLDDPLTFNSTVLTRTQEVDSTYWIKFAKPSIQTAGPKTFNTMQFHKAVIICSLAFQVKNGKAFPNLDTLKQCGGWEATFAASDIMSQMKSITCSMTSTPIWDSLRLRCEWEEEGVIFSCHHQGQGYTIPQLLFRSSTSHDIKRNNEVSGCSKQFLQLAVAVCHWPNWVRLPTAISAFAEILHTGIKTLNLALANLTFSHLQSSKYHKLIKCRIRPALGKKRHLSEGTYASPPPTHLIIESKVGVSQDGQGAKDGNVARSHCHLTKAAAHLVICTSSLALACMHCTLLASQWFGYQPTSQWGLKGDLKFAPNNLLANRHIHHIQQALQH